MPAPLPKPKFFPTLSAWRAWLERNHDAVDELWVGLYKRDSGRPSITWPEAVDGALCFGWIDGHRKSIDQISYKIRFTPRKPGSTWSAVNIRRVGELSKLGCMHPAGSTAFEKRNAARSNLYSYEQRQTAKLPKPFETEFRKNDVAWEFFQSQPPWYRRTASFWVISAKKEETKLKRLAILIQHSGRNQAIPPLSRTEPKNT